MSSFVVDKALTLFADPVVGNQAATKQSVDSKLMNIPAGSLTGSVKLTASRMPNLIGAVTTSVAGTQTALANVFGSDPVGQHTKMTIDETGVIVGVSTNLARTDLPLDISYTKIQSGIPTNLGGFGITDGVSVNGDTMTGQLTLSQGSFSNADLVTKGYVDTTKASYTTDGVHAVGDVIVRTGQTAPNGYFRCNGATLAKTAYTALYSIVGDAFTYTPRAGAGKPWQQQYEFNVGANVDLTDWTAIPALPDTLSTSQAIVTKNRIYLLGGYNPSIGAVATVYTTAVNSDGTLAGWTTAPSLPEATYVAQTVVTKNRVYIIGGSKFNGATSNAINYAPINADGTLGSWTAAGVFPRALMRGHLLYTKNKVYMIGGVNDAQGHTNECYCAPVDDNGVIGSWSMTDPLPGTMGSIQLIVVKNKVHIVSGYSGTAWLTNMFTATILPNGSLSTWSIGAAVPYMTYCQVAVTSNKVYLIGQWGAVSVMRASIQADGSLSGWVSCTNLPTALCYSQSVVVNNKIYLFNGFNGTNHVNVNYMATFNGGSNDYSSYYAMSSIPGHGDPSRLQHAFNTATISDITGWTAGTALPDVVVGASVLVTKNKIHVIGGYNGSGTYRLNTYTCDVSNTGVQGPWSVSQTLPVAIAHSSMVVTKNRVYLLGGIIGGSVSSAVYTAVINTDGSLGNWTTSSNLPSISTAATAVYVKGRVHLISGYNSGTVTTANTYSASVDSSGVIGAWVAGTSLPASVGYSQAVVCGDWLHVMGGFSAPGGVSQGVFSAPINADGTLGAWTTPTNQIGSPVSYHMSVVTKNRVFLLGGISGSYSSKIYSAAVNADGTLGTWSLWGNLPVTASQSHIAVVGGKIYLMGGRIDSVYSANVYVADFAGATSNYTPYYDGTITSTSGFDFKLPDLSSIETNGRSYFIKY